mgnify:CR=1 FL=1
MDFKEIKGIKNFLYDSEKEFNILMPNCEIKGNWRECHEGDWAYTDDMFVCQILKRSPIFDEVSQKNKTLVRTVCGTYIVERHTMKMLGDRGIPDNIYAFSKTFNSKVRYQKDNKRQIKEVLFAKYVARGDNVVSAFKKVFKGANNKSYISRKTNELLKKESVVKMVKKEVELILKNEGVTPEWIVEQYKQIVDLSERDTDKLRSLEALSKMSGLFDTEKKTEQISVGFAGFLDPAQKELLDGEETRVIEDDSQE